MCVGLFSPCPLGQAHREGLGPRTLPIPVARCPPAPPGLLASSQDRAHGASSSPLHCQDAETREVQEPARGHTAGPGGAVRALGCVARERWVTQLRSRGRAPRGRLSPPPCPSAPPTPNSESPTSSPGPTPVRGQHLARARLSMAEWWGPGPLPGQPRDLSGTSCLASSHDPQTPPSQSVGRSGTTGSCCCSWAVWFPLATWLRRALLTHLPASVSLRSWARGGPPLATQGSSRVLLL